MRLLDLCSGAGGAAKGYADAGFTVYGVDIEPQPAYPYPFHQGDAIDVLARMAAGDAIPFTHPDGAMSWMRRGDFAASHASWPCGRYTKGAKRWGTTGNHPDLIAHGRRVQAALGLPYVIENVEQARADLIAPIMLCGQDFGLGVFRHRAFEAPWFTGLVTPHRPHEGRIGDGRFVTVTGHTGGSSKRDGISHGRLDDWERAMGVDWMTARELSQAIPPRYSRYIGGHLMAHLLAERAA
jgi:DNA (cytosine-5)-methyltransferase 1